MSWLAVAREDVVDRREWYVEDDLVLVRRPDIGRDVRGVAWDNLVVLDGLIEQLQGPGQGAAISEACGVGPSFGCDCQEPVDDSPCIW